MPTYASFKNVMEYLKNNSFSDVIYFIRKKIKPYHMRKIVQSNWEKWIWG